MRLSILLVVFIALTFAVCRGEQSSIERILSLKGDELWEAADNIGDQDFSAGELIAIVRRLISEPYKGTMTRPYKFALANCFGAACNKATASDLQELIQIYVQFDFESFEKPFEFQHLAARVIVEESKALDRSRNKSPGSDQKPVSVPADITSRGPELVKAWKSYKALVQPVEQTIYSDTPRQSTTSFQANERAFFKLLDDVLLKRGDGLPEQLIKFDWSGMSGTGSELLSYPRSAAIFVALINERRIPEAVGAALRLQGDKPPLAGNTDARIEFLRACGVDWETAFVGAEIEEECHGMAALYGNPILKELAGFGSDRAATLVTIMARQAKPYLRESYAHAVSAFLTEGSISHLNFNFGAYDRISKEAISPQVKLALVKVLQDFVQPGVSSDVAQAALDGLARAKVPGTKSALYQLLKHPSATVAREAAGVLKAMGEQITVPAAGSPVRFRILVNGEPMPPESEIAWNVGGMFSTTQIGENGILALDRTLAFLERETKPTRLTLSSNSWKTETTDGPTFQVKLPTPTDLDSVTEVNVKVSSFRLIVLPPPGHAKKGARSNALVQIKQRMSDDSNDSDQDHFWRFPLERRFSVALDQSIPLAFQDGDYEVIAMATGAARFVNPITISKEALIVEVQLAPGSDLSYELVRPDGERRAPIELKEGEKRVSDHYYDTERRTYRWLPPGAYVLHIPSSKEIQAEGDDFRGYGPANIPWAERNIPFEITPDSTDVIDLGKIVLQPAD